MIHTKQFKKHFIYTTFVLALSLVLCHCTDKNHKHDKLKKHHASQTLSLQGYDSTEYLLNNIFKFDLKGVLGFDSILKTDYRIITLTQEEKEDSCSYEYIGSSLKTNIQIIGKGCYETQETYLIHPQSKKIFNFSNLPHFNSTDSIFYCLPNSCSFVYDDCDKKIRIWKLEHTKFKLLYENDFNESVVLQGKWLTNNSLEIKHTSFQTFSNHNGQIPLDSVQTYIIKI